MRFFKLPARLSLGIVTLLLCSAFLSCTAMKKPDSCSVEKRCELKSAQAVNEVELKIGESKRIEVCACRPWNQSGIKVIEGQQYAFNIIKTMDWIDGSVRSDPIEGWQGGFYKTMGFLSAYLKRSDQANWYALVGSIGKNGKETFAVIKESEGTVTMHKSGLLHFYANDMDGRYFNNKGLVELQVIRKR